MTTAVSGLIKIGKTGTKNYPERMRFLEANGYYNVVGLKRLFAIELDDYDDKESLLHDIFGKHRVGESELFALDHELVQQLLLSFEGEVVYPEKVDKDKEFDKVTRAKNENNRFSFYRKGIKDGDIVTFIADESVKAEVCGEREVRYLGQTWKLSPLTYELFRQMDKLNDSGAYQGAAYFTYKGTKLKDMKDVD